MTNRRQSVRKPVDFVLNVFQDGLPSLAVAADLSEGGILLRRLQAPRAARSSAVDLEFVLPDDGRVINTRGSVLEQVGSQLRITFANLDEQTRAAIRTFVAA